MKEKRGTNRPTHNHKQNGGPTIGVLIDCLVGLHQLQWLGSVDAAQAHRANLICFTGKEFGHLDDFYDQASVIYDLVSTEQIDGLIIWTTTLKPLLGRQNMEEFCQRYHPLPLVSMEQVISGVPSLIMDDRQGMREAVKHLIEFHGHRRIAFVRGPENHAGARERYQGYIEALAEHRLPLDPGLVTAPPPYWLPEDAAARVSRLLDKQVAPVEAVVSANDDLALGVLWALQARRIRVPRDIAVVGFDNIINIRRPDLGMDSASNDSDGADLERVINVRSMILPLTTVRPPFYELGWRAVEVVLAQLRGEPAPEVEIVPTELIIRRSCGCFSQAVRQIVPEPVVLLEHPGGKPFTEAIAAQKEQINAQLKQALVSPAPELEPDWADHLLTAFIQYVEGASTNAFLAILDELLRSSIRTGDNIDNWWQVLFALRRHTLPYLASVEVLAKTEELWQRVQLLMGEMAERFYRYQQARAEKRDQILREMGQKLIATLDLGQLAEVMIQELPNLGITSCYLALYEPQQGNGLQAEPEENSYPTRWSRSILVYENKEQLDLAADEAFFLSKQLVPGERLRWERLYSMVVQPLYFKDQQLGFALFEVGPREGWVYEVLQGQLSSALQGALLVEREKQALVAVEISKQKIESALEERALLLEQTQEKNRLLQQEISQRQHAEAALQKAHTELELRVAERTTELATANQVLKEQILERQRAEQMQANLEAQLRQSQKMEAIGQLAGGIAHDFNNLLVVIIGYSNLLLSYLPADDPTRKDVEQIKKAGERAASLTRQLLAFSRQQMLQPKILNLNSIVINVETMLQRLIGEDIKLVTLLDPMLASITADPGQIEQIIINLAVNARDAMPQGGQLTIETANVYLDQDYALQNIGAKAGAYVMLKLSDTGIGMDTSTQARLFEPFFTTKPQGKGTGLGLATVFGIVQQSGGHISVSSAPDQGTRLTIYLPQSEQAVEEIELESVLPKQSLIGSETILLVEDDPGVRGVTRRFLEKYGYTVLEAPHGLEALRLCQQHIGTIHLLITDVVMPGMSGRELVERLARIRPEIPVLYVSGYTDSAMIRHGVSEATLALLQKPFTADDLAHKVREMLDVNYPNF